MTTPVVILGVTVLSVAIAACTLILLVSNEILLRTKHIRLSGKFVQHVVYFI